MCSAAFSLSPAPGINGQDEINIYILTETHNFISKIVMEAALFNPATFPCGHPLRLFACSLLSLSRAKWEGRGGTGLLGNLL